MRIPRGDEVPSTEAEWDEVETPYGTVETQPDTLNTRWQDDHVIFVVRPPERPY